MFDLPVERFHLLPHHGETRRLPLPQVVGFAWVMPQSRDQFGRVAVIGVMGGCAQILLTKAYQRARASVVAPFDYTALVYGFLLGWIFFDEVPDSFLIVGGLVVVASGVYIIHRETVVARARHVPPPVPPLPTNE